MIKNDLLYNQSFKKFLQGTEEKKIIAELIKKNVPLNKKMEVLDVGGGNGELARFLDPQVRSITVVEPNPIFANKLSRSGLKCINKKWEDVEIFRSQYDLIVASYVFAYFPLSQIESLLQKMIKAINSNGYLIIFTVDEKDGSWREVYSYFYKLIRKQKISSTTILKQLLLTQDVQKYKFITTITALTVEGMLEVLKFDLAQFGDKFMSNKTQLEKFILKYSTPQGITLTINNWMFLIHKK